MSLSCGLVGLPNVGKSTLFNGLTRLNVDASNYPFCTIEPNHGIVPVPDERLNRLSQLSESEKTIGATVEFVDIAGLVKGAHQGEGLGNQFLSHLSECKAIIHVVRLFTDKAISQEHVSQDPLEGLETIHLELLFKDLSLLENQLAALKKKDSRSSLKKKEKIFLEELLRKCKDFLEKETLLHHVVFTNEEKKALKPFNFLTLKPLLIAANVEEAFFLTSNPNPAYKTLEQFCRQKQYPLLALCAKLEAELTDLSPSDALDFMRAYRLKRSALDSLIVQGYILLNLITFFTTGKQESRAWTLPKQTFAPIAAGVIHSDFQKNFIKVEVIAYDDFVSLEGSYAKCRERGKIRLEGKQYLIQDGEICLFKHGSRGS